MEKVRPKKPPPPADEAKEYMEAHRLAELFQHALTALIYERPDNPRGFLLEFISQLKQARDDSNPSKNPSVFSDKNLAAMFSIMDFTGTGQVTTQQYHEAMKNFGITIYNEKPAGHSFDKINKETFLREMKEGLAKTTSAYHQGAVL